MNKTPKPSGGRADEALLKIAPDELEKQSPPINQILYKMAARQGHSSSGYYAAAIVGRISLRTRKHESLRTSKACPD